MPSPQSQAKRSPPRRRGAAVVLVMLIVSVTLATAYALVWSQGSSLQIQQNTSLRAQARRAALTGLSIALREMHERDWEGVRRENDPPPKRHSLSDTESYAIEYVTGDAALATSDPRWPYRVTVASTGYATVEGGPKAEHRAQAVVQLAPRRLAPPPRDWEEVWSEINSSGGPTVYQFDQGDIDINPPAQIRGPTRLRGKLRLGKDYDWDDEARWRYFTDLVKMKEAGWGDYRPFTNPPRLPEQEQENPEKAFLQAMGVELYKRRGRPSAGGPIPSVVHSYRLYPGGKLYEVPSLQDFGDLEAAPEANPLRIFYCTDNFHPRDGFTLQGTLVSDGDLHLDGTNIDLKPFQLPLPLSETDEPVELPTLIAGGDIRVEGGAGANVTGAALAWNALRIEGDAGFELRGQALLKELRLEGRSNWKSIPRSDWSKYYDWFSFFTKHDLDSESFPLYMKRPYYWDYFFGIPLLRYFNVSLDLQPTVVLQPRTAAARYHWPTDGGPLYVPHEEDDGLLWNIIRWQDGVK